MTLPSTQPHTSTCLEETVNSSSFFTSSISATRPFSDSVKRFLPKINTRTIGTTIATAIHNANDPQYCGLIERIPGKPPTPIPLAVVFVNVHNIPARPEPIMPHTNGKRYFKLTPNIAGSVTPK